MKKLISFLLVTILCVSLFAGCGGKAESSANAITTFSVGYATADITPVGSVPLGGYGDESERMSKGSLEPSLATCVAFADAGGEKLLLISIDLSNCRKEIFYPIRETIAQENNIPISHVLITASHSHSSPYTSSQGLPGVKEYIALMTEKIPLAAKAALADLAPATMETGFQRVDRLNTVRHYLLSDGSYQSYNVGGVPKDKLIGHHSKVDNLLQVVKFTREGDKKPVILVNWSGHPTGMAGENYYYASPNYAGALRRKLEADYDCHASFVLSGSGNVNNGSQIASDLDYKKGDYIALGEMLASHVGEILNGSLIPGKADDILVSENLYVAKNKKGVEQQLPLYAFCVGDWACVTAPFEIFDTNAMAVRDASPYRMTFYASCANEANGYLPTPASFDWEIVYESRITKFPKGMAELVQEQLIGQLEDIFAQSGAERAEKPAGYVTPEFVPSSDGLTYTNPAPGSWAQCREVKNGFYAIPMLQGSDFKTMLCLDKSVAEKVVAATNMQLVFNEQNVIVDVIVQ